MFHENTFMSQIILVKTTFFAAKMTSIIQHILWINDTAFFNPFQDDEILGLSKLKAFADDNLNVTQNIKVVFHRIENIVGKEENAGYQHFLLFPQCFQKEFPSSVSKLIIVW